MKPTFWNKYHPYDTICLMFLTNLIRKTHMIIQNGLKLMGLKGPTMHNSYCHIGKSMRNQNLDVGLNPTTWWLISIVHIINLMSIIYQLQSSRDPNCKLFYPPHVHDQSNGYIQHWAFSMMWLTWNTTCLYWLVYKIF